MRQMVQVSQPSDDVDRLIDYLSAAWSTVPEYAQWWPDLDASQHEVIHLEWVGITEPRLRELINIADRGCLTPEQSERFRHLRSVESIQRPVIKRMLET